MLEAKIRFGSDITSKCDFFRRPDQVEDELAADFILPFCSPSACASASFTALRIGEREHSSAKEMLAAVFARFAKTHMRLPLSA